MLELDVNAKIIHVPRDLRFLGAIAQLEEHLLCKQGVTSSSLVSSTRPNAPTKISGRGARDINVPLALGGRLDLAVQAVSDGAVSRRRGVLVDHRGAGAIVTHSRLEIGQARTGRG